MDASKYQSEAVKFAQYGRNATYAYAGLAEEAGEVLGKYAKFIRKNAGMDPHEAMKSLPYALGNEIAAYKVDVTKELGDVLWMVAAVAAENELDLSDIMQANLDKLKDRKARSVIVGEGDNR